MEVAGYKRNDAVGHDVRYRFRQSRDRGLRESPTRPLRASLRVARWLNPRKKLQAQSCRLVGAARRKGEVCRET